MRVIRAQSGNRQSVLPARVMHEGRYGKPERPRWQPADLLI
jgi:hypothetical protein